MKLQSQLTSLPLAKRLKELGVPQNAYFDWVDYGPNWDITTESANFVDSAKCSAFSVAELGEILPDCLDSVKDDNWLLTVKHEELGAKAKWGVTYNNNSSSCNIPTQYADIEANARASMLIYLIEHGLIKL